MEFTGYVFIFVCIVSPFRTIQSNILQPYGVRLCEMMCRNMMCERCVFIVSDLECTVITVKKPASYDATYHKSSFTPRAQGCSIQAERTSCGDPPGLHGAFSYNTHLSTVYECQMNHRPCGYHYAVSICQGSGTWGSLPHFICKKSKWYRPKPTIGFIGDIPWCVGPGSRTLRINIKATPSAHTIFEIKMWGITGSLVFFLRCRFSDPYVAVNDHLAGDWGKELRYGGFPFKEQLEFLMQITYTGGTFQVHVDGDKLLTFRDRSDQVPERLGIEKDIYVQSVEMIHV